VAELPEQIEVSAAVGATGVGAAVTVTLWGTAAQPVVLSETETEYVATLFADIDCVVSPVLHK
jgi:hypothetical protein